jgi:L-iditol 2-dehydrogenase
MVAVVPPHMVAVVPPHMQAVVLEAPETLVVRERPVPVPQPGEALVRVRAASICGSDMLRVYHGAAKVLPIVLGHEFAGEVVAVGRAEDAGWLGARAAVAPLIPCMTCSACARGLYASCPRYAFIGSRVQGGFAEYVAVPVANLVRLGDAVPFASGALFEPATVTLHALARAGGVAGRTVAVIGVGSIGLLTVQTAVWSGAARVFALDVHEASLEAAAAFGAAAGVNAAREDGAAAVRALTGGEGVDVAIEVSGAPAGLHAALHMTRAGGDVVCVGNQPGGETLSLALVEHTMRQELNVRGAWMSYSAPFPGREWADAAALAAETGLGAAGVGAPGSMFSHETALPDLPAMFAAMRARAFPYRKILVTVGSEAER